MSHLDLCRECKKGFMVHTKVYTYICSHCGFSYRIDPAGSTPTITILNKGKYYEKTRNENR